MATKKPSEAVSDEAVADAGAVVNEIPLSLTEFCQRQSRVKTTSLVTAFFHAETKAGHTKDTHSAFAQRYAEFANTPAI